MGSWSANAEGMFVAQVDGGSGGCVHVKDRRVKGPSWLIDAVRFTPTGNGVSLLDASGRVVANLVHGHGIYKQPDLTRLRQRLASAPVLPASLTAATSKSLAGRWLPAPARHYSASTPNLTFAPDGSWSGSDGCNGQGGRWMLGASGDLIATAGPSTQIGCSGVPVGGWIARARQAGFAGATLVLIDGAGHEIGRLVRG
jgi:hypothetical protein